MDVEQLINYGALGAIVLWFMFRVEGSLREARDAVLLNTRALTLLLLSNDKIAPQAKAEADAIIMSVQKLSEK
jgi:hypothetical protein